VNEEDKARTKDFYFNIMLNYHLSQKLKLKGNDKFNHLTTCLKEGCVAPQGMSDKKAMSYPTKIYIIKLAYASYMLSLSPMCVPGLYM
jgi:hypothetical protein